VEFNLALKISDPELFPSSRQFIVTPCTSTPRRMGAGILHIFPEKLIRLGE